MICPLLAAGQDLSQIGKRKPVKLTGAFSAASTAYTVTGIPNRRDPFYWVLSGNATLDLYGVAIPFSATFSQQNRTFTQPFNQYGLSPTYKPVTLHLGYRSMQFSAFTLAGTTFLGAGVEVAPDNGWVKVSGMYGRLAKATLGGIDGAVRGLPAYERWGYGGKVSLGKAQRNVDFIVFRAKDNPRSAPAGLDSLVKPAENLVLGVNTRQQLGQQWSFDAEFALSAYTLDVETPEVTLETYSYANNLGTLFVPRSTSQFNNATQANLSYNHTRYQVRLSYRRIDPEFRTMGSVFLNNDLEDASVNLAWRMLQNKLNLSATGGLQRNNLDRKLAARQTRLATSFTGSYSPSQRLNFAVNYSNFTSSTRMTRSLDLDSLNYLQVTSTAGLNASYNAGGKCTRHVLSLAGNYQEAYDSGQNNSSFYTANAAYQQVWTPFDLTVSTSATLTSSYVANAETIALGPNLAVHKQFFKKALRSGFTVTALRTHTAGSGAGSNFSTRLSNSYRYKKHHSVSLDAVYSARKAPAGGPPSFTEMRGGINYGYSF